MCVLSTFLDHFIYIYPLNTELLCHLWVWWTQRRENTVSCQNWLHYQPISSRQDGTGRDGTRVGNHAVWQIHTGTRPTPFSCLPSLLFSRITVCCTCLNKHISVAFPPCTTLCAYIPSYNQATTCCFLFRKFAYLTMKATEITNLF